FGNEARSQTCTVTAPTFAISPTCGPAGQAVTVTGSGFAPSTNVHVLYDGSSTGGGSTGADGNTTFEFTVPPSTDGYHAFQVFDEYRNRAVSRNYIVT